MLNEPLSLNLKEILKNPYLIADFIFEEDKRERLNECDLETFEEFFIYFLSERNINKIVKLFEDGNYESYYDFKYGKGEFKEVIKFNLETVTTVFLLKRALVNFFFGGDSFKYNVDKFATEMASAYHQANNENEEFEESIKSNIKGHLKRMGF